MRVFKLTTSNRKVMFSLQLVGWFDCQQYYSVCYVHRNSEQSIGKKCMEQ